MAAYVIVESDITDHESFVALADQFPPLVRANGGKYLARGGATEVVQGNWTPPRLVLLEFDSVERVQAWLASQEGAELRQKIDQCSNTNIVIVEGV